MEANKQVCNFITASYNMNYRVKDLPFYQMWTKNVPFLLYTGKVITQQVYNWQAGASQPSRATGTIFLACERASRVKGLYNPGAAHTVMWYVIGERERVLDGSAHAVSPAHNCILR